MRPPSARVIKPSNQNQRLEVPQNLQRDCSISNSKSFIIPNDNAYIGRSVMKNRKTAFGSISNKRIEQIAISINSTSENADADLSKRFQERYHKTAVEDEHLSSLQMAKSSYIKLKQSRISSQPNIISKPIIQNGAVRAVNLFEGLLKNYIFFDFIFMQLIFIIIGKDISNSTVTWSSTKNQNIKDINNSYIKSKWVNSSFHGNVNSIFQEQPNPLTHLSNNFITPASGSGIIGNFIIH